MDVERILDRAAYAEPERSAPTNPNRQVVAVRGDRRDEKLCRLHEDAVGAARRAIRDAARWGSWRSAERTIVAAVQRSPADAVLARRDVCVVEQRKAVARRAPAARYADRMRNASS